MCQIKLNLVSIEKNYLVCQIGELERFGANVSVDLNLVVAGDAE
jgi:hypothetical protein